MSAKNYKLLIVDDDAEFHQQIRYAFRRDFVFEGALSADHLFRKLQESPHYDLLLLDLVFDDSGHPKGLDLIQRVKQNYPGLPIVITTGERGTATVVEAMKRGAQDFLVKTDFDTDLWKEKFLSVIRHHELEAENQVLKAEVKRHRAAEKEAYSFIGESERIQEIKRILRLVSEEPDVTILITGETGTGKEVAARYLHAHGARRNKPFQAVNLSAIQDTLLESTLFGHRKGAFTGATRDMDGYFGQANTGILMLDEIGDIDANIQVKLLRFLETKLIRPVGSDKDLQLDVQVVAATHRNLEAAVRAGDFRADLYQRLKAMVIEIPPLRERREDIPLLLRHFLEVDDLSSLLDPDVQVRLLHYNWEGNIRELKNTVNYMQLRRRILGCDLIDLNCLPVEIKEENTQSVFQITPEKGGPATDTTVLKAHTIEEEHALIDLDKIEKLLITKNGVKKDVAVQMGLENTDNLRYRIKKYYDKHPRLFQHFPVICENYRRIVK